MAKKTAKKTAKKKKAKGASPLKDRAYKVWLAGLGALAVAESEGGKLFDQLVEKGTDLEKRGKPVVDKLVKRATDKASVVRKKAGARAEQVGDDAKAGWTKVESAVDSGVTAALHRMGIPSRKEIEALTKRVAALTAKLDGKPAKKTTRKPAKKAVRKPAKKTVKKAVKKAVKKTARKTARKAATKSTASAPASAT